MNDTLPTFLDAQKLLLFWHYVKMWFGYVGPLVAIMVALMVATGFSSVILDLFKKKDRNKDDDDDYEMYHL
jgi:hypothetical protein